MRCAATLLFTCATLLAACGESVTTDFSSPEATMKTMVRASNADDREAYALCYIESDQAGMREMKGSDVLAWEFVEVREIDDEQIGFTQMLYNGEPSGRPMGHVLVREKGQWNIDSDRTVEWNQQNNSD